MENNDNKTAPEELENNDLKIVGEDAKAIVQDEYEIIPDKPNSPPETDFKELWITRLKVLGYSAIFAAIANYINTLKQVSAGKLESPVGIFEAFLPIGMLLLTVVLGCAVGDFLKAKIKLDLPSILYISLFAMLWSIPNVLPFSIEFVSYTNKIGLLPLCTPILAYAGISLGKDIDEFKKQGVAIVCVACMAFIGTYVGSAVIAEVLIRILGI